MVDDPQHAAGLECSVKCPQGTVNLTAIEPIVQIARC